MPTDQKTIRKLRAILSADVKGYSLLMADNELATIATLKSYRQKMTLLIQQHQGRVVDSPGDNILAEFPSAVDAVNCAVKIQEELKERNAELSEDRKMQFRIGINIGDVVQDEDRIYGDGVNVAARIEGLAEPGGICISRGVCDHVKKKLELGFEYLGEHAVKNISEPVRVYKVLMESKYAGEVIGEERPKPKQWRWATVAIGFIIVVGVLAVWNFYFRPPPIEAASVENMAYPLPEKPSIAVLPFDNMSDDPDQEFFSDGITEEIITALSKTPKMFVIARNSTFTYKGKPVKVKQVAEELGVRYVLEGSVRKSEDRVRITAQLIDAISGHHLWAERYDRDLKDIFALQDEITMKIVTALQVKLTEGDQARIYAKGTDNLEAYLKAMQAQWYSYLWTKRGNSEAKRLIKEVIAIDPYYAYAYRILGVTHVVDLLIGLSKSPKDSLKKAIASYKKAIALDESLASAYAGMGLVLTMMRKYDEAIRLGKKAIALEPNSADVINLYAVILTYAGKEDEAIPMFRTALRLNPKPPIPYYQGFGHALRTSGQYEEAIALQKKAIEQEPDNDSAYIILATSASLAGYDQEARAAVKEILRIDPQFSVKRLTAPFKDRTILRQNCEALNNAGLSLNCDVFPSKDLSKIQPDKPSIAVLPFINMSNDPEQEYFSDGITDDIITDLSKISGLMVISSNSTFTYKGKEIKIPVVAKELGVKYVLEGSIRRAGDEVRINAQLIDAVTDHHVWADRFDGKNESIFALQDKITERIVSALAVKLSASEKKVTTEKGTNNMVAYDTFLKGMSHLRKFTPKDLVKAIEYFEKAIKFDQNYSEAYANLAHIYISALGIGKKFWDESGINFPTAKLLARHYVENAMKHPTSRGYQAFARLELYKRNYKEAIDNAEHAVSISPNDADALHTLGGIMVFAGKPEEGMKYYKRSIMLDPLHKSTGGIGFAYFVMGDYEQAVKYIEKAIKDYPEDYRIRSLLAASYAFLGDDVKAKKVFEEFWT